MTYFKMLSMVATGLRSLLILLATIVVGLSATFMRDQLYGQSPTTTRYSVFVGAFGMIVGFLGMVALWVEEIPSIIPMVADGLAALFFLAGGIAWAVAMRGQSCTLGSLDRLYENSLLNQGCLPLSHDQQSDTDIMYCGINNQLSSGDSIMDLWPSPLKGLCQKAFANETIQFLGFVIAAILVALTFFVHKKKGSKMSFSA